MSAGCRRAACRCTTASQPVRVDGDATRRRRCLARAATSEHRLACDAVGFGYALRSETQLADLLGCRFVFDARDRAWRARARRGRPHQRAGRLPRGRRRRHHAGADAAELAGERAALALLEDAGLSVDAARDAGAGAQARRASARFRDGLERAFPFPARLGRQASPTTWSSAAARRSPPASCAGACATRALRDQPPQGPDPRRHGPLPGPHVRRARRPKCWRTPAADRRSAVGRLRGAGADQAHPVRADRWTEGEAA